MISVEELFKIYRQGTVDVAALQGLSFNFKKGRLYLIMGPSGSGKSTFLNCIAGLSEVSSGKIIFLNSNLRLDNLDSDKKVKFRFENIGMVHQTFNLMPFLTLKGNILLPFLMDKKKYDHAKLRNIVESLGIGERMSHFPNQVSGGERQRAAIAQVLYRDSPIILCDEPTGELDAENKHQIMSIMRTIIKTNPDKLIVVVSHDRDWIDYADEILLLKDGKIEYHLHSSERKPRSDSSIADELENKVLHNIGLIEKILASTKKEFQKTESNHDKG